MSRTRVAIRRKRSTKLQALIELYGSLARNHRITRRSAWSWPSVNCNSCNCRTLRRRVSQYRAVIDASLKRAEQLATSSPEEARGDLAKHRQSCMATNRGRRRKWQKPKPALAEIENNFRGVLSRRLTINDVWLPTNNRTHLDFQVLVCGGCAIIRWCASWCAKVRLSPAEFCAAAVCARWPRMCKQEIGSMPGHFQWSPDRLAEEVRAIGRFGHRRRDAVWHSGKEGCRWAAIRTATTASCSKAIRSGQAGRAESAGDHRRLFLRIHRSRPLRRAERKDRPHGRR